MIKNIEYSIVMDEFVKKEYLSENEEYFTKLNEGLKYLEINHNELIKFGIDIKSKPWYKNILEFHVKDAQKFYKDCKRRDFNIEKYNDQWIRKDFKSYISELEKFIKFISKIYQNKNTNETFCVEINNLKNILVPKFRHLFKPTSHLWESNVQDICNQLHNWRKIQNKNKHEDEHLDSNYYIDKDEGSLTATGDDILEYISDSIWYIINPLLGTIIVILKNNK